MSRKLLNELPRAPLWPLIDSGEAQLITQGAEAQVYRARLAPSSILTRSTPSASADEPSIAVILKHRFSKAYRHPTLDRTLTRARITSEAKALMRCTQAGIPVAALVALDLDHAILAIRYIEGPGSVKTVLGGLPELDTSPDAQAGDVTESPSLLDALQLTQADLMVMIGSTLAKMHQAGTIHGDLTTSNMMLEQSGDRFQLVLIDFGLSTISVSQEDRAVDLYVLERAMQSTHPEAEGLPFAATRFASILQAYERSVGPAEWDHTRRRLEDVRQRGRKRSMVG
ncbi:uncharacterized protein L969DRAFT_292191 [Mixia osmundae IAM 14324]|uniref:non-specific serine/threonine protein kinase n=1 Tax=Mixia osmundae (strain CBS 9802 / IAM 14324 / JCM 22182 / KY 12970) TaxID=764103 RepID=G7DXK1_MIXOS|nr:uncharacterized protein L969DRAFT_292191 [Mixia osmundae IAM 14324]KEI41194.1 hypothetical protein L969DRAFT_292191 [Mixia osmundae IAM 14324]GAA95311.1 hypothetical protein E5Q_01968 [Mixia osmundae IAM 14324]